MTVRMLKYVGIYLYPTTLLTLRCFTRGRIFTGTLYVEHRFYTDFVSNSKFLTFRKNKCDRPTEFVHDSK